MDAFGACGGGRDAPDARAAVSICRDSGMRRFAEMALDERLLRQLGMAVSYRPVAWRGRLHFISCTFSAWAGGLRSGEWRASAAALDVMKVPGSHSSIFQEPGIRTLAASLDAIFSANEIPKER